jgi:hypothetical protein
MEPVFKCLDRYAMDMLLQSRCERINPLLRQRSRDIATLVLVEIESWSKLEASDPSHALQAIFGGLVSSGHDLGHAIATEDGRNSDSPRFNGQAYILHYGRVMDVVEETLDERRMRANGR